MQVRISVLISDADRMYCDLLGKAFYTVRSRFQVVACTCTTSEILTAVQEHLPQVAIISSDLQDGPMAGIRVVRTIQKNYPNTRTLVTMGSPDRELVIEAFRSGTDGVFCRNDTFDQLCKSVEVISQGQIWANGQQLRYVLDVFVNSPEQPRLHPKVESHITKREAAVVRLAVEGLSNREIAKQLVLTEHTVKNYMFRVFEKLGVSNRVELVLYCLRQEEDVREEVAAEKKPRGGRNLGLEAFPGGAN